MADNADAVARPYPLDKAVDLGLKVMTGLIIPLLLWVNALSVRLALLEEHNEHLKNEITAIKADIKVCSEGVSEVKGSVREINTIITFVREKVQEIAHAVHTHP